MKEEYLNEKDVCTLLGISRSTLYRLREVNGLPYHRIGGRLIRFGVKALDDWIHSQKQNPVNNAKGENAHDPR